MIERYSDSKIKALRIILKDRCIDTLDGLFSANLLEHIIKDLSTDGLLNIKKKDFIPFVDERNEEIHYDDQIYFIVELSKKTKLINLLHDLEEKYPKRPKPLIQERILEIISKDIGNMYTATPLIRWLKDCGVDEELIVYPNTKWIMVLDILVYLSMSEKKEDSFTLCKIIENSCHSLFHNGDRDKANEYRDKFNGILEYDGYAIINNKLTRLNNTIKQELDKEKNVSTGNNQPRITEANNKEQPLLIKIVNPIDIKGQNNNLDNNKFKFPHKLPAGTVWENFIIEFIDDENIYIQIKKFKYIANYKELGMVGKGKNPGPGELWNFLKVLAKMNGEISVKDQEVRDKYKKQKELLAKALQNYFSIDYDPFFPYNSTSEKSGKSYKIKCPLFISDEKAKEKINLEQNEDEYGIKEYLNEEAPQI